MLTLVICSTASFTDSHTDDPDGSNHCYAGRKLWLIWDSETGISRGLEDIERCEVYGKAAFDLDTFLAIRGSRWFIVSPGQTLFLPGNYAHKVITLKDYIGIGSFFVMLPAFVRTLLRWSRTPPLWTLTNHTGEYARLLDDITRLVTRRIQYLNASTPRARRHWGLRHLQESAKELNRSERLRLIRGSEAASRMFDALFS